MRAPALLLVASALLAGCTVESPVLEGQLPGRGPLAPGQPALPPPGNETLPPDLTADNVVFPAPIWVRGDSWRWSIDSDQGGGPQQFVLVSDVGTDYLLASTDEQDAVETAFLGRSLPGRVSKQFLSGYDQGAATRFLDFPLQQNKTWLIHVRGTDYRVQANYTANVPGGRGPGFVVEGASADGNRVTLAYSPAVKWMTRFQLLDPAGANIFTRTLAAHTTNYTGPYFLARAEELFQGARNGTVAASPVDTFNQGRDFPRLRLALNVAGTGEVDVRVIDPAGQVRYNYSAPSTGGQVDQTADLPGVPGAWRVLWAVVGPVDVRLRVAGMDVTRGDL